MPKLPAPSYADTWLAMADPSMSMDDIPAYPRGIQKIQVLVYDPATGAQVSVRGYAQTPADAKRTTGGSPFLLRRIRSYKPDGDLYTILPPKASGPAGENLTTYLTPRVQSSIRRSTEAGSGSIAEKALASASRAIRKTTSVAGETLKSGQFQIGIPYAWSPAPMPHWAMFAYDQAAADGVGAPEIFQPSSYIRIGTVSIQNGIGPIDLQISQSSQVSSLPTLRQGQTVKRVSGNVRRTVDLTLQFPDAKSIQEELIPLLRQCRRAPFVPVIHTELYDAGIDALAIESVRVSTMSGTPEALQVQIKGHQFNWRHYMLDAEEFDLCFNYPLLDLWLEWAESREEQRAPYNTLTTAELSLPWTSRLRCYVPSRDWLSLVNENTLPDIQDNKDRFLKNGHNLLYDAVRAIATGDPSGLIRRSPNDKLYEPTVTRARVLLPDGSEYSSDDYVAIPLTTPELMQAALVPISQNGANEIVKDPKLLDDGVVNLSDGSLSNSGPGADTERGKKLTAIHNKAGFDSGYWGFWRTGRAAQIGGFLWDDVSKNTLPKIPGDPLNTPLGVSAQQALLDPTKPVYLPMPELEGLVITGITGEASNTLAEFSPEDEETPVFQHTGTSDTQITIEGICPDTTARLLEDLVREVAALSVDFRGQYDGTPYGGYCYIENEIARVCGVTTAVPISLSVDVVPNFPSERRITLSLASFDIGQRRANIPQDFGTTESAAQTKGVADREAYVDYNDQSIHEDQYAVLEAAVHGIELYPDMSLPTWDVLSKWVIDLKSGAHGVWDYKNHKPRPGYEFVRRWPYPEDYWPTAKTPGYMICLDDVPLAGERSPGNFDIPNLDILDHKQTKTGALRYGYVDPDFYCASRGDRRQPTGYARIQKALDSLMGDTKHATQQSGTLYWSSDGSSMISKFGSNGVALHRDSVMAHAADAHVKGSFEAGDPTGKRLTLPVPLSAKSQVNADGTTDGTINNPSSPNTPSSISAASPADALAGGGGYTPDPGHGGLYLPLIRAASQKYGIPVALIQAMIHKESDGNPRDHNSKGYSGLMQIKNGDYGVPPNTPQSKLFDPAFNIDAGTAQFADALKRHKGDVSLALADYDAGQGAVRKYKGIPPFKETQDYVRLITADYARLSVRKSVAAIADSVPKPPDAIEALQILGFEAFEGGTSATDASNISQALGVLENNLNSNPDDQSPEQTADKRTWDADRAAYDPLYGEDMFYALRRSEMSGRLMRAFPTYLIFLVDGGPRLRVWRLSDVFYGLHSAMSIEVFSSRKIATDTAAVTFADPYNNLSAQAADVALAKENDTRKVFSVQTGWGAFVSGAEIPTDDLANRRQEELRSLLIKAGSRLHIRLGFGSDASQLPTVFNGTITGVKRKADVLEIVALGDGQELTNTLSSNNSDQGFYVDTGTAGSGRNLGNIIKGFFLATSAEELTKSQPGLASAVASSVSSATAGFFLGANPYGIEHFGSPTRSLGIVDAGECGVNVYSGWSDHPVNVTYATEDWPGVLALLPGLYQAANKDLPQAIVAGAEKLLGVVSDTGYSKAMDECGMFRKFQGEPIVGLNMENATPWDVISTLRYVATDYIRVVEPFGLRSTLFFGKSYWPLHYRYSFEDIARVRKEESDGAAAIDTGGTGDLFADRLGVYRFRKYGATQLGKDGESSLTNAEFVYRRRPYVQIHLAHSGMNLLSCEVEATDEGWASVVQSMGTCAGATPLNADRVETSYSQFLDANLFPEFQRQKTVKSGLYSGTAMRVNDTGYSGLTTTPFLSTNILNNHAVGVLHDEVREMYQGDIVTTGNGWVRPFHILDLNDDMRRLAGIVEVGEVLHSLSPSGGFVTVIKPDCLATAADPSTGLLWGHARAIAARLATSRIVLKAVTFRGGLLPRRAAAVMLRAGARLDHAFEGKTIGALRFAEWSTSRNFRRRWSKTKASGKVNEKLNVLNEKVNKKIKAFNDLEWVPEGAQIKRDVKGVPTRRELRDTFERELNNRAMRGYGGRAGRILLNSNHDVQEFRRLKKIDEDVYNNVTGEMRERYYVTANVNKAGLTAEETELKSHIDAAIDSALGRFSPADKEGNLIVEHRLSNRIADWFDPYHGESKTFREVVESLRRRESVHWLASVPHLRGRLTPEAIAEVEALSGIDDVVGVLKRDGFASEAARGDALYEALLKAKGTPEVGFPGVLSHQAAMDAAGSPLKAELDKFIVDQEALVQKLKDSAPKLRGEAYKKAITNLGRETRHLGQLKLRRERLETAIHGPEAGRAFYALSKRLALDNKAAEIMQHLLEAYGHKLPVPTGTVYKAATTTLRGLGTATGAAEKVFTHPGARKAGAALVKGAVFIGGKADPAARIAQVGLTLATAGGLTLLDRYLMSRHALFISPLRSCGREFSAGINGHRGLVLGDSLGPLDSVIAFLCDDTANPVLPISLGGLLGVGVHYYAAPDQYRELLDGMGLRTDSSPEDFRKRYEDHLAQLAGLNSLGYNSSLIGQGPQGVNSSPYTGPLLAGITGRFAEIYKSVVSKLANSPNIHSTGGLIQEHGLTGDGTLSGKCARAIKQALTVVGFFGSYPTSGDANALDAFCAEQRKYFSPPNGPTALSKIPDGALCFWPNLGDGSGHVAFKMTDSQGIYLLGNTEGELKYRGVGKGFATVAHWYLPAGSAAVHLPALPIFPGTVSTPPGAGGTFRFNIPPAA